MPQYPILDKVKTGKQLKQLIKNKGYTIKDIQQYLSLSCIQTIYRWFDGINIPSVDNLYAPGTGGSPAYWQQRGRQQIYGHEMFEQQTETYLDILSLHE